MFSGSAAHRGSLLIDRRRIKRPKKCNASAPETAEAIHAEEKRRNLDTIKYAPLPGQFAPPG